MTDRTLRRTRRLTGLPLLPGDKSISHRALLIGALAHGTTRVTGLLDSGDVRSTARCLAQLGVTIETEGAVTSVTGGRLAAPARALDCGNSGTTLRSLVGVLASQPFASTLTGDDSLVRRPMKRVAQPLREMGARIELTREEHAPLNVRGGALHGIEHRLPVASAQLKTALLLAALSAEGVTTLTGELHSRDHTERMLRHFGVDLSTDSEGVSLRGGQRVSARELDVPGDPSTAAFFVAAASLVDGADVRMENLSLNPTRIGFLDVVRRMGGRIELEATATDPEPVGRARVRSASLRGVRVTAAEVPLMIDELPLLAVLATQAHGVTEVFGAEELRVKESDRLAALAHNLTAMGADVEVRTDGFRIEGPLRLHLQ